MVIRKHETHNTGFFLKSSQPTSSGTHPRPRPSSKQLTNAVFFDQIWLTCSLLILFLSISRHITHFTSVHSLSVLESLDKISPLLVKSVLIFTILALTWLSRSWYSHHRNALVAALICAHYLIPRTGLNNSLEFALGCQPASAINGGFVSGLLDYLRLLFWSNVFDMVYSTMTLPLPLPLLPLTFIVPLITMSLTSENSCLSPFLANPTFAKKIQVHTKVLDSLTLSGLLKWAGLLQTQEYSAQRQCEVWLSFFRIVVGGVIPHMLVLLFRLTSPLCEGPGGGEATRVDQQHQRQQGQQHQWLKRADDYCWHVWGKTKVAVNSSLPPIFLWFVWLSAVWGVLAPALATLMPKS